MKQDFRDKDHWSKNWPSPFAKWMYNFSVLGFLKSFRCGLWWWFAFNPAMLIMYITLTMVFILTTILQ